MAKRQPEFDSILNFRDVAVSVASSDEVPDLRTGKLFRSADIGEASPDDNRTLREHYGIKTVIDLYPPKPITFLGPDHSSNNAFKPQYPDGISKTSILGLVWHRIGVYGPQWSKHQMTKLTWMERTKTITKFSFLGGDLEDVGKNIQHILGPRLTRMSEATDALDKSTVQIKTIFEVLADPAAYPVLIFDHWGKEKTGLVICLVLLLLGVDMERITHDYQRSAIDLAPIKDKYMENSRKLGRGEEWFECPDFFVPSIEEHLRVQGGIEKYLLGIGVSSDDLRSVRNILGGKMMQEKQMAMREKPLINV